MLDTKIASALNKIIPNSYFRKKVSLEEQKAQTKDRFLRRRQIAFMIYEYTVLDYADLFALTLQNDDVQEFETRWDEILLSMNKIPTDDVLENLCKYRIRESVLVAKGSRPVPGYDRMQHQRVVQAICKGGRQMLQ